jgi:hypothetical protein
MYIIKDVPGKGKGLVATERIPKGTRILSEQPVITIPPLHAIDKQLKIHIQGQVDSLDNRQRQSLLALYNLHPYNDDFEQYIGIFKTNALPIETDGIGGGIFLEASRLNHSCKNNAQKIWNQGIKRHTVHALRDIAEGEEITVYYLALDMAREVRRKELYDRLKFMCACPLCSLPLEESEESDKRLKRIAELDNLVGRDCKHMKYLLRTLRYVDEQVRLYEEQGPGDAGLPRAYFEAVQIAVANGDLARGSVFAHRAVEGWRTSSGSDCREVIEYGPLAHNPGKLPHYGMSMKWKTSKEDVPTNLDTNEFENWLWKRELAKEPQQPEKVQQPEQLNNLRNRKIFPAFNALPRHTESDSYFYRQPIDTTPPAHHWCFLGEIVNDFTLGHLEVTLKDIDDTSISLHFYTADRGAEITPTQLRKGNTVAVINPERRNFISGPAGIRHEDAKMLRVRTFNRIMISA